MHECNTQCKYALIYNQANSIAYMTMSGVNILFDFI